MAEFSFDSLPRKQMAAGALIRDGRGRILIVKPTYRPEWLVPGGSIETDESPHTCVVREVEEELGMVLPIGRLLCIEYQSRSAKRSDNLRLIFDGGVLDDSHLARIHLPASELSEYRFVQLDEALRLLAAKLNHRIARSMQALHNGRVFYLENGTEQS